MTKPLNLVTLPDVDLVHRPQRCRQGLVFQGLLYQMDGTLFYESAPSAFDREIPACSRAPWTESRSVNCSRKLCSCTGTREVCLENWKTFLSCVYLVVFQLWQLCYTRCQAVTAIFNMSFCTFGIPVWKRNRSMRRSSNTVAWLIDWLTAVELYRGLAGG